MSEHRFFVHPNQIADGIVVLEGAQARQIRTVLRLKTGDNITVLDGSGRCHIARIDSCDSRQVRAGIIDNYVVDTESCVRLTLAQALPKGDKAELVVQKATELGISEMVVFASERTVPSPAGDRFERRLERWRTIAQEAAEQSCRAAVPEIRGLLSFEELLGMPTPFDLALIAWENESGLPPRDAVAGTAPGSSILFAVGPEGGFSEKEIAEAEKAGFRAVSCGRRILRTETASIAGCAIILHCMEEACAPSGRNSGGGGANNL